MSFGLAAAAPAPHEPRDGLAVGDPTPAPARTPPQNCPAGRLPVADPAHGRRPEAARAVAACLTGGGNRAAAHAGTTLRAATLTVTGLFCPPTSRTCRAATIEIRATRLCYAAPGGDTCTASGRVTLTGRVRFRADSLHGRTFGLLPLTLSTRAVPPVPLPYLVLTDVEAAGLWARADRVDAPATVIAPDTG
ncbi:hypothetical protein GCM10010129_38970 [Streptomyces fumigatiscleroticus]|nr:hypothetical protein GCM10010129_38970 [Streptomyces fumigatiscleroticus]